MIVGLLGSSCSGKSFFLNLLHDLGYYVPLSVTTRPQRDEEIWHLQHIGKQKFEELNDKGKLCFVTEAFGNVYACMEFSEEAVNRDVAIIITKDNIPELRRKGGFVIRIAPSDVQEAARRIQFLKREGADRRIADLFSTENSNLADVEFRNSYDQESCRRFVKLIDELRGTQSSHQ